MANLHDLTKPTEKPKNVVEGLCILADWFDRQDDKVSGWRSNEVQQDLRRWAEEIATEQGLVRNLIYRLRAYEDAGATWASVEEAILRVAAFIPK